MLQENISATNENFERYKERISNFSGEFEFGLFLFIAKKTIPWIALFISIAFISAYLYLRYTPPVFESSSIIQVQSSNQANKVLDVENFYEKDNGLAETVELLRSKVFLKRVLEKLPLEVTYFAEGTFSANELYTYTPYTISYRVNDPSIIGTKIYIDFSNSTNGSIRYSIGNNVYKKSYTTDEWIHFPLVDLKVNISNFAEIEKHQNIVKKNAFYFVINDPDVLVNEYYPRLNVKLQNDQAKTILIGFKDFSPKKAMDVVSTITAEFKDFDIERKAESSKSVIEFIDQQLEIVYDRLKVSETSLQSFKKDFRVSENENITNANLTRLNNLDDQIISLELEENVLARIEKSISDTKSIDPYNLLAMLSGTESERTISSVINQLHNLLIEKEEMLYEVTPGSEAIKSINFQIEIQKKLLKQSIISVKNNIQNKKEDLKQRSQEFESKFNRLPENEVEYSRLQRLFSINEKYYTLLMEKRTEYSISKAGFVAGNTVLEKASIPHSPVTPNRKMTFLIYVLTAIIISLFVILGRYLAHNEINSLNEITKHTHASISILGIVPKCKHDIPVSQLLVDKNPKSLIAEAFRSIRTNLQFISNEPGSKINGSCGRHRLRDHRAVASPG
ncbi:MAG TPA: Wzz/FepE/Etk N-terminal domain-containing protein [Bacteroidia bacterium]|nr:Wzz/FepE/Etk N-terminal domain-containing protein [Bacteroidia bacterium]